MTVAAGLAVGLTAGMGVLSAGMALGQPASFGIDNEGKYTQFKASVRAAEYVREDYILGSVPVVNGAGVVVDEVEIGSKPRVIGVLAATMAFVERNPSAETAAISAFTAAMDDVLSSRFHSDPDLTRPENFLAALRFGRVLGVSGDPSLDPLIGFDTDINDRAFELLGLDLPEATSRPQMERRVRAHEAATAVNLGTSLEFGELLVRAFMNQGPEGGYLTGSLSSTMSAYLLANGYNPASGDVRPEHTGVNAAMAALPTSFAQLQNELMQPFVVLERLPGETEAQYRSRQAPSALQNRMRTAVYEVLDVTDQAIGEIGPEVTFDESNFLSPAEREAILAEMRASIRATSGPRTSVLANSFLLYNDIQQPAELVFEAQETGSSIIGVSNAVSTGVAGAKLGVAASKLRTALAGGNAAGAVGPFITTADGLIKLLGISEGNVLGGRTTGDVYNQIVSLQSQLADMEVRIDGRFDRIDSKLDALFTTLNDQYEAVLDLTATVDFAVNELLDQSNAIRRLDDTVRAMGRDELNQFFDIGVNKPDLERKH